MEMASVRGEIIVIPSYPHTIIKARSIQFQTFGGTFLIMIK